MWMPSNRGIPKGNINSIQYTNHLTGNTVTVRFADGRNMEIDYLHGTYRPWNVSLRIIPQGLNQWPQRVSVDSTDARLVDAFIRSRDAVHTFEVSAELSIMKFRWSFSEGQTIFGMQDVWGMEAYCWDTLSSSPNVSDVMQLVRLWEQID